MNSPVARASAALLWPEIPRFWGRWTTLTRASCCSASLVRKGRTWGAVEPPLARQSSHLVVGLGHDRIHHQSQVLFRRVVDRDHQADDGLVTEVHPRRLASGPGPTRTGYAGPTIPGIPH